MQKSEVYGVTFGQHLASRLRDGGMGTASFHAMALHTTLGLSGLRL